MTFPKYRNIEDLIKKSNKFYFRVFGILFEFRKNVRFSKFRPQINVHLVRLDFRSLENYISGFLESI